MAKAFVTGLKSWQTTLAAILTVVAVVIPALQLLMDGDATTNPNWNIMIPSITVAVGLIFARDGNKTSEDVGAK